MNFLVEVWDQNQKDYAPYAAYYHLGDAEYTLSCLSAFGLTVRLLERNKEAENEQDAS